MTGLLLLIQNIAPGLYLMAGLGIAWGLRLWMLARRELSWAQFPLERENAEEQGGWGISMAIISLQFIVLVWLLSNVTYQAWTSIDTSENTDEEGPRKFQTAIPVSGGGGLSVPTAAAAGIELVRTQPPSPTFAGTLRPADPAEGCIRDQAFIEIPDNGQVIFQTESVIGTASIQNFGYYRFEIRSVDDGGQFGVIGGAESDYTTPIIEGPLGSIIPQNFVPGEYRFRLAVFDTSGAWRAWCEITIFISEPLPTPTPIGGGIAPPAGISAPTQAP